MPMPPSNTTGQETLARIRETISNARLQSGIVVPKHVVKKRIRRR